MHTSDLKVRKIIKYGLKWAEKSRSRNNYNLSMIKPEEIRVILRDVVNQFIDEYKVKDNLNLADNEIIPWVKDFCNFKDPCHLEVMFVLLRLRLFAHFKMIDDSAAQAMVEDIENKYDAQDSGE